MKLINMQSFDLKNLFEIEKTETWQKGTYLLL